MEVPAAADVSAAGFAVVLVFAAVGAIVLEAVAVDGHYSAVSVVAVVACLHCVENMAAAELVVNAAVHAEDVAAAVYAVVDVATFVAVRAGHAAVVGCCAFDDDWNLDWLEIEHCCWRCCVLQTKIARKGENLLTLTLSHWRLPAMDVVAVPDVPFAIHAVADAVGFDAVVVRDLRCLQRSAAPDMMMAAHDSCRPVDAVLV